MSDEQMVYYTIAWGKPKGAVIIFAYGKDRYLQYVESLK